MSTQWLYKAAKRYAKIGWQMTRDEREQAFKGGLEKLQADTGIGIVLVEIPDWQPPDPIQNESAADES